MKIKDSIQWSDKGGLAVSKLEELAFSILSKLQSLIRWITSAVWEKMSAKETKWTFWWTSKKFIPSKPTNDQTNHHWWVYFSLSAYFYLPSMPQIDTSCVANCTLDSNVVRCTRDLTLLSSQATRHCPFSNSDRPRLFKHLQENQADHGFCIASKKASKLPARRYRDVVSLGCTSLSFQLFSAFTPVL